MAEPIKVAHADLMRRDSDSPYKSICPVCNEGTLYVHRNPVYPYYLMNTDQCTNCGQKFIYGDIPNNQLADLSVTSSQQK